MEVKETSQEQSMRLPIREDLFSMPLDDLKQIKLRGSRCQSCGEVFLGKASACGNCAEDNMTDLTFSNRGTLWSYTVILYGVNYVTNIKTVSQVNNYVAINSAISIDLTGQINAETVFAGRMWNGALGQVDQHIGATLSKGGKAITCIRSTGLRGAISRIVPQHEPGTVVSVPRYFADHVVSEYGIAKLMGKTQCERAHALVGITHPDFRDELKKEAVKLFG